MILGEEIMEQIGTGQAHLAAAWLPSTQRLLEIGCSTGYLTSRFLGRARRTFGLDINLKALRSAKRRHPTVPLVCSDVEHLPFADGSFDVVVMLEVIEHVGSDLAAIAEIRRILRVGGTLILSTPHAGTFAFLDPYNLKRAIYRRLPLAYTAARRLVRYGSGQYTENLERHRHYRMGQLASRLEPYFVIRNVHRGGLLLYPVLGACIGLVGRLWNNPAVLRWMYRLLNWEFRWRCGPLSYNLMVLAERVS